MGASQGEVSEMADRVGQQLGNYYLTRLLGWGGFADVYLGRHIHLNTLAAIKILHTQLTSEDVEQFLNEARTLVRLDHPHIVKVLDFGIEDNIPFLVMTYAPNGTLRQRHPKGSILPINTVISYVHQIAAVLQYLHDQRLIHRDIKPENLLIGINDEILLSDFGTALLLQTVNTHDVQGLAGTLTYMAPEQLQGKPRPASDQYGLAVIVYEWLCGACPFKGSFAEISSQHMLVVPPSLQTKNASITPEVERVVMTGLAKDPTKRFSNVKDFATALEQAASGEASANEATIVDEPLPAPDPKATPIPTTAEEELAGESDQNVAAAESMTTSAESVAPVGEKTIQMPLAPEPPSESKPSKRGPSRRAVLLGLAGVAIVGIAGAGFILPGIIRGEQAQTLTPTIVPSTAPVRHNHVTILIYRGHTSWINALSWTPDGVRIASASADKTVQVWDAATGNSAVTYNHDNYVKSVKWSPDGKYLASAGRDKTVEIQDGTTGAIVFAYHRYYKWVDTVAWSPDGTHLASASVDKTARIWDALTGDHVLIYRGHTDEVNAIAWSPSGTYVASASSDKTVQVWEAATGNLLLTYSKHTDQVKAVAWSLDGKRIISGSWDHTIHVWDATAGTQLVVYSNHTSEINSVALAPDGKRVATSSNDQTVQIWDSTTGTTLYKYKEHNAPVHDAIWSPNGQLLASGGLDDFVKIWKAP